MVSKKTRRTRRRTLQRVAGDLKKSRQTLRTIAREIPSSAEILASVQTPRDADVLVAKVLGEVSFLRRSVDAITKEIFALSGTSTSMNQAA